MGEYTQTFKLKPRVKQRPRLGRRGKAYTPEQTRIFEASVAAGWGGPCMTGPVNVVIHLYKERFRVIVKELNNVNPTTALRGDIDNYAKAILDGLNGVAYTDDSNIRRLLIHKHE